MTEQTEQADQYEGKHVAPLGEEGEPSGADCTHGGPGWSVCPRHTPTSYALWGATHRAAGEDEWYDADDEDDEATENEWYAELFTLNIDLLRDMVKWAEEEDEKRRRQEDTHWNQDNWARADSAALARVIGTLPDREAPEWKESSHLPGSDMIDCGTAFCIAGRVCAETPGVLFVIDNENLQWTLTNGIPAYVDKVQIDGRDVSIEVAARARLLGLDVHDPSLYTSEAFTVIRGESGTGLFDGENTLRDVKFIAADIAKRFGYEL